MQVTQAISIQIPPVHHDAGKAIEYLAQSLKAFNTTFPVGDAVFPLMHFRLALDEGLLNAIEHGCRSTGEQPIGIFARFSQTVVEISIEDPGPGFEYEQIKLKTGRDLEKMLTRGVTKGKGWGLAIMQSVSQGLFWNQRGNRVTLLFQK